MFYFDLCFVFYVFHVDDFLQNSVCDFALSISMVNMHSRGSHHDLREHSPDQLRKQRLVFFFIVLHMFVAWFI